MGRKKRQKHPNNSNLAMTAARSVLDGTFQQADAARHYGITRQAVHRALERLKKRTPLTGVAAGALIVDDPMGRP